MSPSLHNKRILQIVPSLNSGGVERTVVEIAQAIGAAGGTALVATSGGRMIEELKKCEAKVFILPLASKNPFILWQNSRKLKKLIIEEKIDLVHARSRAPAWSAYSAAKAMNIPFITTYHGIYSGGRGIKEIYNRVMVKGIVTIANSQFTKTHILATHKVRDVRVINRGVDVSYFYPRPFLKNDLFTFLMPARIARGKGFEVLFQALKFINIPCKVIIVGEGRSSRYGQTLQPPAHVEFVGHVSDMALAYAQCDCVLIPATRPEAFGRIAIEAGAMGKIALASNIGGMKETIINNITGFHFEAGDARALAAAMTKVMQLQPHEREKMQEAATKNIKENFTLALMQEKTLAIYNEILRK